MKMQIKFVEFWSVLMAKVRLFYGIEKHRIYAYMNRTFLYQNTIPLAYARRPNKTGAIIVL